MCFYSFYSMYFRVDFVYLYLVKIVLRGIRISLLEIFFLKYFELRFYVFDIVVFI